MSNRRSINFIQVLLLNDISFGLVRLEAVSIGHADDLSTTVKNHQVLRLNIRGHSDGDGVRVAVSAETASLAALFSAAPAVARRSIAGLATVESSPRSPARTSAALAAAREVRGGDR